MKCWEIFRRLNSQRSQGYSKCYKSFLYSCDNVLSCCFCRLVCIMSENVVGCEHWQPGMSEKLLWLKQWPQDSLLEMAGSFVLLVFASVSYLPCYSHYAHTQYCLGGIVTTPAPVFTALCPAEYHTVPRRADRDQDVITVACTATCAVGSKTSFSPWGNFNFCF